MKRRNFLTVTAAGIVALFARPVSAKPEKGAPVPSVPTTPFVVKDSVGNDVFTVTGSQADGVTVTLASATSVLNVDRSDGTEVQITSDGTNSVSNVSHSRWTLDENGLVLFDSDGVERAEFRPWDNAVSLFDVTGTNAATLTYDNLVALLALL